MSNFLHSNNGSLFALEYSLFNKITDQQTSEQFADEEEEEIPQTNTQAFDVGEAIALEYQEDTEPDFESMSSQYGEEDDDDPEAYTSRGFDLQSENIPTYDVEALTIEDEETPQLNENSLAKSHSLFALEQSVFASSRNGQAHQFAEEAENTELDEPALSESHSLFALEQKVLKPTNKNLAAQQFAVAESFNQDVEAQAFDWDEAIALKYEASAYPTPSTFDWLPTDESSHNLEDESLPFEVEAFEVEEEPASAPVDEDYNASRAYGFEVDDEQLEPKPEELNNSQSYGFDTDDDEPVKPTPQKSHDAVAIPVNATVVTPLSPPLKSAQPVEALSDNDFDELERGNVSDRTADAEAFAADLAAIMRGEEVYEPPAKTPASLPPAPPPQPALPSQAQSVAPKKSSPHDIFDQMGRNMAHATAFDLGTFSLEQRFDEFDRLLDEQESTSLAYTEEDSESEDENISTKAQSFDLDDEELAADVAALSVDEPWQAVQFGQSGSKKAVNQQKSSSRKITGAAQQPKPSSQAPKITDAAVTPTSPKPQMQISEPQPEVIGPYGSYSKKTLDEQQEKINLVTGINPKSNDVGSDKNYIYNRLEQIIGRMEASYPEEMKTKKMRTMGYQGWKLHIAVWPDQAAEVVTAILPKLIDKNVNHKIVDKLETYTKDTDQEQYGKYITIYTTGVEHLKEITTEINGILSKMISEQTLKQDNNGKPMPKSEGDYSLGNTGMISTRYGSFTCKDIYIPDVDVLEKDNRKIVYPSNHKQAEQDFKEIEKFNEELKKTAQ